MAQRLDRIAEAWSELRARAAPERATAEGDHRFDDRLGDWSPEGRAQLTSEVAALRAQLDPAAAQAGEALATAVLAAELDEAATRLSPAVARWGLLDPEAGPHRAFLELVEDDHPRADARDGESLRARMAALPLQFTDISDNLLAGQAEGVLPSPRLAARVLAQIDQALAGELERVVGAAARELAARSGAPAIGEAIRGALEREVAPAYRALGELLRERILPAALAAGGPLGMARSSDGEEAYAALCRLHTTRALPPEAIDRLAGEELAAADERLAEAAARLGHHGPRAVAEARAALAVAPGGDGDPVAPARALVERALAAARPAFLRLTDRPCKVTALPASQGEHAPPAYYLPPSDEPGAPGRFLINLHRAQRPRPPLLEVLAAHEAVPGHHLQLCHALDTLRLPPWRRRADLTAYVEGWGLYAESLAGELGLYSDAARFACAELAAWRAARMRVDVGLHVLGWSSDEARAALAERTPFRDRIEQEIDRYLADPAQVHSYVIGARAFADARRTAERRLGERFSLARFHARVLDEGALPLDALAARVAAWDGS